MMAGALATYPGYYRRKYAAHRTLSITVLNSLTGGCHAGWRLGNIPGLLPPLVCRPQDLEYHSIQWSDWWLPCWLAPWQHTRDTIAVSMPPTGPWVSQYSIVWLVAAMLAGAMATYPGYYRRKYATHRALSITVFNSLTSGCHAGLAPWQHTRDTIAVSMPPTGPWVSQYSIVWLVAAMLAGALATYPGYYRRKYATHRALSITVFNSLTSGCHAGWRHGNIPVILSP